jgi:Phage integrase central domain
MHRWIAHDAEKRKTNAWEAISVRMFDDSQAKWKELLVRLVERGGTTEVKRNWVLLRNEQSGSRIDSSGDSEADQRRRRTGNLEGDNVRIVHLPVYQRKWKDSTNDTETNRIRVHLVGAIRESRMRAITREQLQDVLDAKAAKCGRSMIDHMRFRLCSIFELAISEGIVDRNPASAIHAAGTVGRDVSAIC